MNKIVSIKITSSIFLATLLILGTLATISPSFMVGAQAVPEYGMDSYGSDYGMNNSYDKRSYGNDNSYDSQYSFHKPDYKPKFPSYDKDNYKSKKDDNSKNVSINKIKCINNNLNINGNNAGNVSIGNKGQGYSGGYSYGSGSGYYGDEGYGKQGKGSDCIINNNNTNTNIGGGNQTIPPVPPEQRATLLVTKTVRCEEPDDSALVPSIQQISADCDILLAAITEDQFNITVTDTNVNPPEFLGSETGQSVTLDAGPFTVTETPDDSVAAEVAGFNDIQTSVTGPFPSFSGDCTQTSIGSFSATGEIAAGGQETCNIVNNFVITEIDPCEVCFNANATLAGIITAKLALPGSIPIIDTGGPFAITIPADVTTIAGLCDFLEVAIGAGTLPQTTQGLTAVINSILAAGPLVPTGASPASITALVNCLLDVDFGGGTDNITAGGLVPFDINTNTAGGLAASNINTAGDPTPSFSSPPTIAQETEASSSALEKVTKLKQQWLDLLP